MEPKGQSLQAYQAIVAAPTFSVGVRCVEDEILGLDYLEPRPEMAPTNALAAVAMRQLEAPIA